MNFVTVNVNFPASISKPYDMALTAVCQAREAAIAGHKAKGVTSATFMFRQHLCAVFTTPSGQLRYQIGPIGKPSRDDASMIKVLADAEREAQEFAARGTRVPVKAEVSYCEGHAPTVLLTGRVLLALPTTRGYNLYFHVGAMPRGQVGRKDYGGEMVAGPWAFANGRAVCLTANRAIAERDAAEEAAAIMVKDGDLLVIDNAQYKVEVVRGEWLTLHLLQDFSAN